MFLMVMLVKPGDDLMAVSFCYCWCSFTLKGLPSAPAHFFFFNLFVCFIYIYFRSFCLRLLFLDLTFIFVVDETQNIAFVIV